MVRHQTECLLACIERFATLDDLLEDNHIAVDELIRGTGVILIHVLGLESKHKAVLPLLRLLAIQDLVSSVHL